MTNSLFKVYSFALETTRWFGYFCKRISTCTNNLYCSRHINHDSSIFGFRYLVSVSDPVPSSTC